jgi:quercetin dioxygenase-like cupin family protein
MVEHMHKVKVVKSSEVESKIWTDGCSEKWIFDRNTPTENLAWAVVIFDPGISSGLHKHDAEEILQVLHGRGKVVASGKEYEIEPGTAIYVPPEQPHNLINTGKERLELVFCVGKREPKTTKL